MLHRMEVHGEESWSSLSIPAHVAIPRDVCKDNVFSTELRTRDFQVCTSFDRSAVRLSTLMLVVSCCRLRRVAVDTRSAGGNGSELGFDFLATFENR